ncbi:MAG TPA: hypothetical protein VGT98_15460, partial [Candidatus Elarobacter sp.]|nr:hypothetical protein [Candidatus Elarobacter sp.]
MALAGAHPLANTIAAWMWLLPVFPLIGFVVNGLISLLAASHVGPDDPDMGHGAADAHDHTPPAEQGEDALGHNNHAVTKPRFGGLVSLVGPGVLAASFILAALMFFAMRGVDMSSPFVQTYWSWMPVADLQVNFAFQLDQLSMLMVLIITGVGTLIHIFSVGYMGE